MKFYRAFSFVFTSVATGLAAAFLLVLLRPDLVAPQGPELPAISSPGPAVESYADAVAVTAPSVVNVFATKVTRTRRDPLLDNPLFRRYFGYQQEPLYRQENSLGSGVIVDVNGYILTNNHVIDGASEIRVVLGDGRQLPARIVGTDPDTDLAVLQAGGEIGLPLARLGRSEQLRVGDVVLAIGNPFGVGKAVSLGIVSATGRNQLGLAAFENFIQTDAAINRGNSGGALINTRGEVVGINTAILSESGGSHGIGFAIPAQIAREVMRAIIEHGRVVRGWLGITVQNLTQAQAETLRLEGVAGGSLVAEVLSGGPADRAGVQAGDVITHIDGQPINDSVQLLNLVASYRPSSAVQLEILRERRPAQLRAQVAERPQEVQP